MVASSCKKVLIGWLDKGFA